MYCAPERSQHGHRACEDESREQRYLAAHLAQLRAPRGQLRSGLLSKACQARNSGSGARLRASTSPG